MLCCRHLACYRRETKGVRLLRQTRRSLQYASAGRNVCRIRGIRRVSQIEAVSQWTVDRWRVGWRSLERASTGPLHWRSVLAGRTSRDLPPLSFVRLVETETPEMLAGDERLTPRRF